MKLGRVNENNGPIYNNFRVESKEPSLARTILGIALMVLGVIAAAFELVHFGIPCAIVGFIIIGGASQREPTRATFEFVNHSPPRSFPRHNSSNGNNNYWHTHNNFNQSPQQSNGTPPPMYPNTFPQQTSFNGTHGAPLPGNTINGNSNWRNNMHGRPPDGKKLSFKQDRQDTPPARASNYPQVQKIPYLLPENP